MASITIRQYGLQRTGTNAIKALLEENSDEPVRVLTSTHGSKHDMPTADATADPALLFVVSIKDPVSWLASYHRYRKLQCESETPPRTIDPISLLAPEWLAHWRRHTVAYLTLAETMPNRTAVVQHETLLRTPGRTLKHVANHLGLPLRPHLELFRDGYARRGDERTRGADLIDSTRRFNRNYHLNGDWAHELPRPVIRRARQEMDTFALEHPDFRRHFNLTHLEGV